MMKYLQHLVYTLCFILVSLGLHAVTNTATTSGAWETTTNWSLGHAPLATEDVVVPAALAMTVNAPDVCLSLTIAATGSVTINGTNGLSIAGNFSNAGTFTAAAAGSTLTFNAAANSTVTGAGTYTIAGTVIMNMTSSAIALDVQSANFISGINTGANYYFTFTQGVWRMDNAGTLNDCYNSGSTTALTIPFGATIESDLGIMNLCKNATTNNAILSGELFMNGGTVNVQTGQGFNSGQDFRYKVNGGTPQLYVSSGTLNVGAGFNALTGTDYIDFHMTGGTIILALNGYSNWITFQLADVLGGKTFMTAGTIILQDACNVNIEDLDMGGANVAATLYSVTGGTVQLGYTATQASSTYFGVNAEPATNYPNIDFEAGTAKNVAAFVGGAINVLSVYINPNMTFDANGFTTLNFVGSNGTFAFNHSGTFNLPSVACEFTGSVLQVINGTFTTNFGNVIINNSGPGVSLGDPEQVGGTLTLTNGLVTTTAADILTIEASGSVSGGSTVSYVNGPMTKIGNSAFVFPVGNAGVYAQIGITAPATATNQITAQHFHTPYVNTSSVNAPLVGVSTIEYWTLSQTASDAVNVSLYWQNAAANGILTFNNTLRVAHFNGAAWDDEGQTAITAGSPGNVTSVNLSTFGPFTFGTTNLASNPLPISLLSFNAQLQQNGTVNITWETATEINNKEFTVERTVDGINFEEVTSVPGAGNSSQPINYSAIDEQPLTGVSYYRLKQTDFDGKFTYSHYATIDVPLTYAVSLFPIPAITQLNLNYTAKTAGMVTIKIVEAESGKCLQSYSYSSQQGINTYSFNVAGLENGSYVLQVTDSEGNMSNNKFIKE